MDDQYTVAGGSRRGSNIKLRTATTGESAPLQQRNRKPPRLYRIPNAVRSIYIDSRDPPRRLLDKYFMALTNVEAAQPQQQQQQGAAAAAAAAGAAVAAAAGASAAATT